MYTKQPIAGLLVSLMLLLATPGHSGADGWLDGDLVSWNVAGMAIPAAPGKSSVPAGVAYCESSVRPPETPEDAQVADRGWLLRSPYQLAWGISLVQGFLQFDLQCRPVGLQAFVFVDGVFAGTLAPQAMSPRLDGALFDIWIRADEVGALYDRYAPTDGLCCPSAQTLVSFTVERTVAGPVVTPTQAEALPAPSPGR